MYEIYQKLLDMNGVKKRRCCKSYRNIQYDIFGLEKGKVYA